MASVEILLGNIVEFQADVLVNVIAVDTNQLISAGVVSQAFLTAGGQQLQRDFEQQTQPKEFGKYVAVTRACGDLQGKFVYHAAADHYTDETSAKLLYDTIFKCLTMAIKAEQMSIAFPTVGCGKLGFPVTTVADCFTRAVKDTGNNTLKVFILTLDEKIYRTFSAIVQHISYDNLTSPEAKLPTAEARIKAEKVTEDPVNRARTSESLPPSETAAKPVASAERTSVETLSSTGKCADNGQTVQPLQPSENLSSTLRPSEPTKAAAVLPTFTASDVENLGADSTFALQTQQQPQLESASVSTAATASPVQAALKEHVLKALTLNGETLAKLLRKFEDLGVDSPADILMLTEADLSDCLKTIHFRKLLAATKATETGFISTETDTVVKGASESNAAAVRPVPVTPKPVVNTEVIMRQSVRAAGTRPPSEPSNYYSAYAVAPKRASDMIAARAAIFDPAFAGQASAVQDSKRSGVDSSSSSSSSSDGRPSSVLITAPRGFIRRTDSSVRPVIQSPQQELPPVGADVVSVPAAVADDAQPNIDDQQTAV